MSINKFQIVTNTLGHIIAFDISEEAYMQHHARYFCEWVNGAVVKSPSIDNRHNALSRYLGLMFTAYFKLRPVGYALRAPFIMRLAEQYACYEPDIQLLLTRNKNRLKENLIDGPSDIVIEIVSEESQARDYAEKLYAYERGGVSEYWIIDPLREESRFYVLNRKNALVLQDTSDDFYSTPRLPGMQFPIFTLWEDPLPSPVGDMVKDMLETNSGVDETYPGKPVKQTPAE
jgi:Uma2 family endonuclease